MFSLATDVGAGGIASAIGFSWRKTHRPPFTDRDDSFAFLGCIGIPLDGARRAGLGKELRPNILDPEMPVDAASLADM